MGLECEPGARIADRLDAPGDRPDLNRGGCAVPDLRPAVAAVRFLICGQPWRLCGS